METFKYYKVDKAKQIPQIDDVEVFDYAEIDNKKVVGVLAEDHLLFENAVEATQQTFAAVENVLLKCHLNKQFNKEIVDNIRKIYTVDDEISLMKKADDDTDKILLGLYIDGVKDAVNIKKVGCGLKQ